MLYRILVSGCLNVTQFGIATTFLLLIARSGSDILSTLDIVHADYCCVILVIALMLIPVILLKSPKDFWYEFLNSKSFVFCTFIAFKTKVLVKKVNLLTELSIYDIFAAENTFVFCVTLICFLNFLHIFVFLGKLLHWEWRVL